MKFDHYASIYQYALYFNTKFTQAHLHDLSPYKWGVVSYDKKQRLIRIEMYTAAEPPFPVLRRNLVELHLRHVPGYGVRLYFGWHTVFNRVTEMTWTELKEKRFYACVEQPNFWQKHVQKKRPAILLDLFATRPKHPKKGAKNVRTMQRTAQAV